MRLLSAPRTPDVAPAHASLGALLLVLVVLDGAVQAGQAHHARTGVVLPKLQSEKNKIQIKQTNILVRQVWEMKVTAIGCF